MQLKIYTLFNLLILSTALFAQTSTWQGNQNSDWNQPLNWSPNFVPQATDNIFITSGALHWPVFPGNITANGFTISSGGSMDMNGYTLTVNSTFNLGGSNTVTVNNSNSTGNIVINLNGTADNLIGKVIFNDNVIFNITGSHNFFDGFSTGSTTYTGDVTYNMMGNGILRTCNNHGNIYNGDLTLVRSVAGSTELFSAANVSIGGNFTYNNTAGGLTSINSNSLPSAGLGPVIAGQVNIDVNGAGSFTMGHIKNNLAGGNISLQNITGMYLHKDTIQSNFSVSNVTGSGSKQVYLNRFVGDVSFSENASNTGIIYFGGNLFEGTTNFIKNSGATMYTGYSLGSDVFDGPVSFEINGSGLVVDGNNYANSFNNDLTVNRTVAGNTTLFSSGLKSLTGNFTFINSAGGNTNIYPSSIPIDGAHAAIVGQINIDVNGSGSFNMKHLVNNTSGGYILLQNITGLGLESDTLLADITISNLKGNSNDIVYSNQIFGNFTLSDDVTNTANIYVGGNHFVDDASVTINSNAPFLTGYGVGKDVFDGSFTLVKNGTGAVTIGNNFGTDYNGDFILNINSGLTFSPQLVTFGGDTNTVFEQNGSQALIIPNIKMNKTNNANLSVNKPVTLSMVADFTNGHIINGSTNPIIFPDAATHLNASVNSHVVGVVQKNGNDSFTFPVGTTSSYNPVSMTAPAVLTNIFSAEYILSDPTIAGFDTSSHAATVERVSGCEYWDVKRLSGTSNVALTLAFEAPCAGAGNYVNDPNFLHVVHWNDINMSWDDLGNGGSTGSNTGTVTTAGPVMNFSPFTIASTDTDINPLPLNLLFFKGEEFANGQIHLNWKTANENLVSHFEVEKSLDGFSFNSIGSVNAHSFSGEHHYEFYDPAPDRGPNYYRLKIISTTGDRSYSQTISVRIGDSKTVNIYPVPAHDFLFVHTEDVYQSIEILDINGKSYLKENGSILSHGLDISWLEKGIYLIRLRNDKGILTEQFIKQ